VAKDTHSDLARSQQSVSELIAAGAVVVIGPESADIASAIAPMLAANHLVFLSPLVGAAHDALVDCTHPRVRPAPSARAPRAARALGEALATLVWSESRQSAAVLYAAGAYNEALSGAFGARFATLGGQVAATIQIDPDAQSYAAAARQIVDAGVQSIVLATEP